ncbi:MAG: hypothetical protein FDZ75_06625 [Actinobacteria bacterium]|nr:MAG: hypothetical protein FDZ75_06625 [Actinomycetota bacterium]
MVLPVPMLVFWAAESWLHSHLFDGAAFAIDFLHPDAHEMWMRLIVFGMLTTQAVLWSQTIRRRNETIERQRAYQLRLSDLTAQLAYGDAQERRELATRVHENVAQQLTAARMFLSAAEADKTGEALRAAERIVDRCVAELRDIAEELSPPVLDEYGLGPALEALGSRAMRRTGTSIEVDCDATLGLGEQELLAVFTVTSEIIQLAATDADVGTVRLTATALTEKASVLIEWDGPGSHDLFGMCERLSSVGGSLERRHFAGGTSVLILVPLGAPQAA